MFVTGVQDTEIIKEIVSSTRLPVNVVGLAKTASISTLTDCGVKRVSMAVFLCKERKSNDRKTGGAAIVIFITIQTFLGYDLKQGSNNRYPVSFTGMNHSAWIKTMGRN